MKTNVKLWLIPLLVMGLAATAYCEPVSSETAAILRTHIKLLQAKVKTQAATIKTLQAEVRRLTLATKVQDVSIERIVLYATRQAGIRLSIKAKGTSVRKLDFDRKVRKEITAMLDKGIITLTYPVIDVLEESEGTVKVRVGCPAEIARVGSGPSRAAWFAAKRGYHRVFSFRLTDTQALAIKKGAKLILKGRATIFHSAAASHVSDARLSVLHVPGNQAPDSYGNLLPALIMNTIEFTLNNKTIESVYTATPRVNR